MSNIVNAKTLVILNDRKKSYDQVLNSQVGSKMSSHKIYQTLNLLKEL